MKALHVAFGIVCLVGALASRSTQAQVRSPGDVPPKAIVGRVERRPPTRTDQLIEDTVYPPALVIMHQYRIGLTETQRDAVLRAMSDIRDPTAAFAERLDDARATLVAALRKSPVNEKETAALMDRVLSAERDIKLLQLTMLVRVKNLLTAEQQAALDTLRRTDGR